MLPTDPRIIHGDQVASKLTDRGYVAASSDYQRGLPAGTPTLPPSLPRPGCPPQTFVISSAALLGTLLKYAQKHASDNAAMQVGSAWGWA